MMMAGNPDHNNEFDSSPAESGLHDSVPEKDVAYPGMAVDHLDAPEGMNQPPCITSQKASHGFLCESEEQWQLRKDVFTNQEELQIQPSKDVYFRPNRASLGISVWFQFNYEPNFSCFEKRIGQSADGAKRLCSPHRVREVIREQEKKCVVLSFGPNKDFSFEEGVLSELPECDIHAFDSGSIPENVPTKVQFHPWGLGPEDSENVKTLSTTMKQLGIGDEESVEVLKVDVHDAEWDVFVGDLDGGRQGILASDDFPFIRQLLIKLYPIDLPRTRKLFELMRKQGYVIAHKEPDYLQGGRSVEYTFLKINMAAAI